MAGALIGVGIALIVLTFLLAFTLYGEICGVVGVVCLVVGAVKFGQRPPKAPTARP
jgi:hypothetical protein